MKFTINLAKMQCELQLDQDESSHAQKELYQFLSNLSLPKPEDELKCSKSVVNSLLISQQFNISKIVDCLERKSKNGTELNGALFSTVVKLINRKKLFGDEARHINFDRFIFEIYDNYFQEYCVILNANMPIPSHATIRIKPNKISDNFQYEIEPEEEPEEDNQETKANKTTNKKDHQEQESNSQTQSKLKSSNNSNSNDEIAGIETGTGSNSNQNPQGKPRRSRVLIFSNSNMKTSFNSGNSRNNSNSRFDTSNNKLLSAGSDSSTHLDQSNQQFSSEFNLKSIVHSDYLLFKSIIRCLYNDRLFESVKKRLQDDEVNDSNHHNGNDGANGSVSNPKSHRTECCLQKNKIIEMIWSKVARSVTREGFNSIRMAKCQQLFHQCVCLGYLMTLDRNDTFSKACQSFELFNYIHGKIMAIHYRLEELELPGNSLCGQCEVNMFAIKRARIAFREKQRANNQINNNPNNQQQQPVSIGNNNHELDD